MRIEYGALCVAMLVGFVASTATAQQAEASWDAAYGLVVGANPTAAGATGAVKRTIPLYRDRDGVLWDSARVEVGLDTLSSPSFTDVGLRLYFEPIAIFDVTVVSGSRWFYNGLGFGAAPLRSYADTPPSVDGSSYDGSNGLVSFSRFAPRVKAAAGPLIFANTFSATLYEVYRNDIAFLEEPRTVSVIARNDWVLENEAQLLYRFREVAAPFLAVGVSHRSAWVPAASADDRPASQRSALLAAAVVKLTERLSLQAALFGGAYVNGEPIAVERPYLLGAFTLLHRLD